LTRVFSSRERVNSHANNIYNTLKSVTQTCAVLGDLARSAPALCEAITQILLSVVNLQNIRLARGSYFVITETARTFSVSIARLLSVSPSHNVRGIW
jgi:hypothetical protein